MRYTDKLYIEGVALDMTPGTRITLTYKSPLLSDITKMTASYSQTIKLPRTSHNETTLGLPLHLTATSSAATFRYRRKAAAVERDGIMIASGEAYLMDSDGDSISVAFIFGRLQGLQELKDLDITINDLGMVRSLPARNWKSNPDAAYSDTQMMMPEYNTGESNAKMIATNVGYYGAVSIYRICTAINSTIAGGLSLTTEAREAIRDIAIMCQTANDSDYTASLRPTTFAMPGGGTQSGLVAWKDETDGRVVVGYDFIPSISASTAASGKYGTVVSASVGGVTSLVYQVTADQKLTILPNSVKLSCRTKYAMRDKVNQVRLTALIATSEGVTREIGYAPSAWTLTTNADGMTYELSFIGTDWIIDLEAEAQVQIRFRIPAPTTTETEVDNISITSGNISLRSSGLGEPITVDGGVAYQPAGNLPEIKPIDLLKAINAMFGLYARATSSGGLQLATLNEVLDNLGAAVDWSDKLIFDEGKDIQAHYFSLDDYKAQRNVIAYKEDSNDPDAGKLEERDTKIIIRCNNEALDAEKTLTTLPFAAMYGGDSYKHYTYKEATDTEEATMERAKLQPRIVKLVDAGDVLKVVNAGITASDLARNNLRAIQDIVRNPHRIKVKVRLSAYDLKTIDLATPVYIARFGCYFLIAQIQTTSTDITDVELIKI